MTMNSSPPKTGGTPARKCQIQTQIQKEGEPVSELERAL